MCDLYSVRKASIAILFMCWLLGQNVGGDLTVFHLSRGPNAAFVNRQGK